MYRILSTYIQYCTFMYFLQVQTLEIGFCINSIPVIVGILPDKYLRHYSHLVADIPLLTAERTAKLDLDSGVARK